MEDIFIQALVTRCQTEEGLINLLPDDIKVIVEEKLLSLETQTSEEVN